MSIKEGTRLGQYEIVGRLGAGGMGEVYRARDTRLHRDVAVKALAADFAADPARLARFETEARSASALSHPSIVTIHEIGRLASTPFIVMELVEGKTLREVLYPGALPLRRAVHLAAQLADALAAAHEAGVVHRDLKPENVMVTREGFVKILDFGLAKLESPNGASRLDLTVADEAHEGAVVGTAGYMSPEQASGQRVDFRSDQFALGTLVYEMLSGRRAFQRPTRAETIAAVIREEPEALGSAPTPVPAPLRWLLERCLAKLPEDRYASTRDLARELQSIRDHFSQIESGSDALARPLSGRRSRLRVSAAVGAAVAALVTAAYLAGLGARSRLPPSFHRLTFREGTVWSARFAPDGQTVLYGAAWEGGPIRVYSTRPEIPESAELLLPPANVLGISPAGELAISLGARSNGSFTTLGTLARAPLAGGGPREILEAVQAADWAPDGASLAVIRTEPSTTRLEFPVGRVLYATPSGYLSDPRISPRGDLVAFLEHPMRGDDSGAVAVVDREGRRRTLSSGWTTVHGLAWSPDGKEVWFTAASVGSARALHAVSLSGRRRLVTRAPGALTLYDVSREGRALLARDHARALMIALSPAGSAERNLSWHDWSRPVDLSADGTTLLFDETGEGGGASYGVYLRNTNDGPAVRLGDGRALGLSPDGKWALSAPGTSPAELLLLPTGAGQPRPIGTGHFAAILRAAWIPGGERLVLAANEAGRAPRLFVQPAAGGVPRAITPEGVGPDWAVSPDGTGVVAASPERQLLLYPVSGGPAHPIRGAASGDAPIRFSPDGRWLYVLVRHDAASSVYRIDLGSGARDVWKEIAPADAVGVLSVSPVLLSADGESYVYAYVRLLDELYLVDGLT